MFFYVALKKKRKKKRCSSRNTPAPMITHHHGHCIARAWKYAGSPFSLTRTSICYFNNRASVLFIVTFSLSLSLSLPNASLLTLSRFNKYAARGRKRGGNRGRAVNTWEKWESSSFWCIAQLAATDNATTTPRRIVVNINNLSPGAAVISASRRLLLANLLRRGGGWDSNYHQHRETCAVFSFVSRKITA